jgi:ketosteroid isomerase-like protein
MDTKKLAEWCDVYKRAWENQDADLFVNLFTDDCTYRETPFTEPIPGHAFHAFWQDLAKREQDNHIEFEILGRASGNRVILQWEARTTSLATSEHLEGSGIFVLTFADNGRCSDVREWQHWHSVGAPLKSFSFTS